MPISYAGNRAVFTERCIAEEADALLDWLRRTPDPAIDLGGCDDLHTALVQLLLAARAPLTAPPPDHLLAACLGAACPSLPVTAETSPPPRPVPPPAPASIVPEPQRPTRRRGRGGRNRLDNPQVAP